MNYSKHVSDLRAGKQVQFRPKGNSMKPKIESGQLVTLIPCKIEEVDEGDIVLCKVNGHYYVHLVSAIQGDRRQISNNHGHVNGWVGPKAIYGKVIKVEA